VQKYKTLQMQWAEIPNFTTLKCRNTKHNCKVQKYKHHYFKMQKYKILQLQSAVIEIITKAKCRSTKQSRHFVKKFGI
jgi:hypothetical protein